MLTVEKSTQARGVTGAVRNRIQTTTCYLTRWHTTIASTLNRRSKEGGGKQASKQALPHTPSRGLVARTDTPPYKHGSRRDLWISSNSHKGKSSASHVVPAQRRVDRSVGADRGGAPRPHKEVRDRHRHRRRRRLLEAHRRLAAAEHRVPRPRPAVRGELGPASENLVR